jgi:flavin reductase (DIM6/NTAB) family NADH-FMN oxidoreductase RutF
MFYASADGHGLPHNPLLAIVSPRPIGWITAANLAGVVNLAPYSFCNVVATKPDLVCFSSQGRKDSLSFIEEAGDFVFNVASWDHRDLVNASSAAFERGVSELEMLDIATVPSGIVASPRVAGSPAALECVWVETIPLKGADGTHANFYLVIGEIVGVHIDDAILIDGRVDTCAMQPILRGGYHEYFRIQPADRFEMKRPDKPLAGTSRPE